MRSGTFVLLLTVLALGCASSADIDRATLRDEEDISVAQMRDILATGSALILDTRPRMEWAISHIPGARNVAPKAGVPMSEYVSDVAEVERIAGGDRSRSIVLYCNGPHCGKSRRLNAELQKGGFTRVARFQLGAPVWRALGGVMVTELEGARHVFRNDRTAVWVDARDRAAFESGSLPRARHIPPEQVKAAKDDGRLPMEDHNTRIIVFASDSTRARSVAEAIAREAFHNVSYLEGDYAAVPERVADAPRLPSVDLPPELDRVLRDYERAWQANDENALAELFAEDGFVMSNTRPPVRGRDAIRAAYADSGGPLALRAFAYGTDGSVGWIIGAFGGEPSADSGKFVLALRRGADGRWLIAADIDNSNRPPR